MKKYLWAFAAFLFVVGLYLVFRPNDGRKVLGLESITSPSPTNFYENMVDIETGDRKITAAWYKVGNVFNLNLIPNFEEKENASDVFENNVCKVIVNAGFYMEDGRPAGLFISDGIGKRGFSQNKLFDGILSINYLGTPRITRDVPSDTLKDAVQTGPILKENAELLRLNIIQDKNARRVVAAVTGDNELYFIVFYDKSSAYLGPLLSDMPDILASFEEKTRITFADAINLDGGSASAFYTEGFSLSEISPVGAFFCEK